jgi:hypothetical protein
VSRPSLPAGRPAESLALLRVGALSVLARQDAVHSVAARTEAALPPAEAPAQAAILVDGREWPVYCLDEQLAPLGQVPEGRRLCVLLRDGSGLLGLLVDEVVPWAGRAWRRFEVPACMRVPGSPIDALALAGGAVYGVLEIPALAASLGAARAAPALREAG